MGEIPSRGETWRFLEEKMRNALRLRHRSLSTEKTCLIWVRSFRVFVGEKQPDQIEGRDSRRLASRGSWRKNIRMRGRNGAGYGSLRKNTLLVHG